MINFFLIHYNSEKLIEYQVKSIRKFVKDNNIKIYFTIDAENDSVRNEMIKISDLMGIEKIFMPYPHLGNGQNSSICFGLCINYIWDNYISKNNDINVIMENDIFFISEINVEEYLNGYQMAGEIRWNTSWMPSRLNHFWGGFVIFNNKILQDMDLINFNYGEVKCNTDDKFYNNDTGSFTYYWVEKHKKDIKLIKSVGCSESYDQFESYTCEVHNITHDKYLLPEVFQDSYNPSYRVVIYENFLLHLEGGIRFFNDLKINWFKNNFDRL